MNPVPRFILWGLLAALGLYALEAKSLAQPPAPEPQISVLEVLRDNTKFVKMSSGLKIAQVRSENPKVIRVQSLLEDPTTVVVTGLNPGFTRITLTDEKKNVEAIDIRVPEDTALQAEQMRQRFLELARKAVPTASVDVVIAGNTVILSGTAAEAEQVQPLVELARGIFVGQNINLINNVRIGGVQQVQLEVTVATVNRSEARKMAFNFFENRGDWFINSLISPPLATATSLATGLASATSSASSTGNNIAFGILSNKNAFSGYFQALRTEGLAKIVAEPRVITLSGRPANITSGGEIPIISSSTGGSTSSYKNFGTIVDFVPIVLGNGKIHLEVSPTLSTPDASLSVNIATAGSLASAPGFRKRSAQVAVQMEDGQTLAIGGLIQRTVDGTTTKVPVLGDLPFIGVAFRTVSLAETEEELLILVTPRLVDPLACNQLPKHVPGRETRTPDDFELFLEGIMEAPRGQRDVFPGGHYKASHLQGGTAGIYPCGDSPHSWNRGCARCGNGSCNGQCGTSTAAPAPMYQTKRVPLETASPATPLLPSTLQGPTESLPPVGEFTPGVMPAPTPPSLGPALAEEPR